MTSEQEARDLGFKFGEMHPGAEVWNFFPESQDLQKAFAEGWAAGQEWWNEKQEEVTG